MEPDAAGLAAGGPRDVGFAETGLAMLIEAAERAVEGLGSGVPPAQIRALLIIDRAGSLNLSRLADSLGASASAVSRLCDRIQAAGLLTRDRAAASRREIVLLPTESGRRLAEWVRGRRRAALSDVLRAMTPDGREALAQGLGELAAGPAGRAVPRGRAVPGGEAVPGAGAVLGGRAVPGAGAVLGGRAVPGGEAVPGAGAVPGGQRSSRYLPWAPAQPPGRGIAP